MKVQQNIECFLNSLYFLLAYSFQIQPFKLVYIQA